MKIAEETSDNTMKEDAKVSFGMAQASMKWNEHITRILKVIEETKSAWRMRSWLKKLKSMTRRRKTKTTD